jgi:biotin-dependent carboxylase-like uncharacterized protein
MSAALAVLSPGPLTTVQDLGRSGRLRYGVPIGGALDPIALRAANALVGNAPDAGGLECVAIGPSFVVEAESARIAFAGAEAEISVARAGGGSGRARVTVGASLRLERGDVVRVGGFSGSALLYMAVEGGFDIAPVMGSVSTYVRGEIGGWRGRPLQAGDRLPLVRQDAAARAELAMATPFLAPPRRLRVIEGPQADFFSAEEIAAFHASDYVVGAQWSRMGARLDGRALKHRRGFNIASDAIACGSIQVPGDGRPIVLMAEHQTIGGYPKIATVITADLPALGRLGPGSRMSFERVTMAEAEAARREMAALIESLPSRAVGNDDWRADMPERLFEMNLISGVVDAGAVNA